MNYMRKKDLHSTSSVTTLSRSRLSIRRNMDVNFFKFSGGKIAALNEHGRREARSLHLNQKKKIIKNKKNN